MEKIDFRKLSAEAARELKKQVIRQKQAERTNQEVSEITGINVFRVSRIWCAYKEEGTNSYKREKSGRKPGSNAKLSKEQQREIRQTIIDKTPDQMKLGHLACGHANPFVITLNANMLYQ